MIIQNQVQMSLNAIESSDDFVPGNMVQAIRTAYMNLSCLGALDGKGGLPAIQSSFWTVHSRFEDMTFQTFIDTWNTPTAGPNKAVALLVGPMMDFNYYYELVNEMKWDSEKQKIITKAESWVCRYFQFLFEMPITLPPETTSAHNPYVTLQNVTVNDCCIIFDSILLLSWNHIFCETFGLEKMEFNNRLHDLKKLSEPFKDCFNCRSKMHYPIASEPPRCQAGCRYTFYLSSLPLCCGYQPEIQKNVPKCNRCQMIFLKIDNVVNKDINLFRKNYGSGNNLIPSNPYLCKWFVHVDIPKSYKVKNHFAHLPYEYCSLAEKVQSSIS